MERVAFPGLGLEFNLNPTAFTVFGIDIQWYGIILSTGIVLAFLLLLHNAVKKEGFDSDTVYNITLLIVPISIIGARFVYVATKWDYYKTKGFFDIINIRGGGIAIYGAIIFGLVTVLIYNKIKHINTFSMLDALAPSVMLGQIVGRWGNFMNAEAYGWSEGVENLPWRMELDRVYIDGIYQPDIHFVHPTFFYESLWNAIGLALILLVLYRKKKFDGEIFFAYIGWYGLGRAFIESIRADSLYLIGTLKFSVFVGIVCVIAAIIGEIVLYKKHKNEQEELKEYKPSYASARMQSSNEADALADAEGFAETTIDEYASVETDSTEAEDNNDQGEA